MTPDYSENIPTKVWHEKISQWKSDLSYWEKLHQEAAEKNKDLLNETALNDFDHTATFTEEVGKEFGILTLTNGAKAFVHLERVWINKGPMYGGGFRCLRLPTFNQLRVNGRKIPPTHGCEYQVTFCHCGVNTRDWVKKKFTYSEQMQAWMKKIVTFEKMENELRFFQSVNSKGQIIKR